MLRDTHDQIELVIPYDPADDELDRRYTGRLVRWGDDPEMTHHDYDLPTQFWFSDARGAVSLNGIRSHTLEPIMGTASATKQCRLWIDYAAAASTRRGAAGRRQQVWRRGSHGSSPSLGLQP